MLGDLGDTTRDLFSSLQAKLAMRASPDTVRAMANKTGTAEAPVSASSSGRQDSGAQTLELSRSDDLVVALVGHIGAGLDDVRGQLNDQLHNAGYATVVIKISDLIAEFTAKLAFEGAAAFDSKRAIERTEAKQLAGTWLRKNISDDITASLAVRKIRDERKARIEDGKKRVFIVDSLKHPREVELLRRLYGNSFYLVSVLRRLELRKKHLEKEYREDHLQPGEIDDLIERDEADTKATLGQQVRKTLYLGDFFVDNDHPEQDETDPLAEDLARFVSAVLEREIVRPRADERGMFAAWSASLRSACLSRQVGAALVSSNGLVIATGTNDVPRATGGLYEDDGDPESDKRCFNSGGYCRNDATKTKIYEQIFEHLQKNGLLAAKAKPDDVRASIEATPVRDLVEFSRAVHAEMDALLSVARSPGVSTQDATLYCTTYPCHSCARHLVAAGIREVVYIEPYTKSRAVSLHGDSIVETTRPGASKLAVDDRRLRLRLFSGVAPRRYASLFEKRGELKNGDGTLVTLGVQLQHRDAILDKSFMQLEELIAELAEKAYDTVPTKEGGA